MLRGHYSFASKPGRGAEGLEVSSISMRVSHSADTTREDRRGAAQVFTPVMDRPMSARGRPTGRPGSPYVVRYGLDTGL